MASRAEARSLEPPVVRVSTTKSEPDSVLAVTPSVHERSLVLKHGDSFALFDAFGDITSRGMGEQGVYHFGTRHLDRLELRLSGRRLLLLGSTVHDDGAVLSVDLTNADIEEDGELLLHKDTLHVHRRSFLHRGELWSQVRVRNYGLVAAELELSLRFHADFADLFEIRGWRRDRNGESLSPVLDPSGCVDLRYEGLDGVERITRIRLEPAPDALESGLAKWVVRLDPGEDRVFGVMACFNPEDGRHRASHRERYRGAVEDFRAARERDVRVSTSNEHFNGWIERSASDLHLLVTKTRHGDYPYAGVPWFSTPFGRDGILTALMFLWVNPDPARGVLRYLAATQADEVDDARDAEPGKILHERREGEMASLGEVPFGRYYGSVDATPLFIVLANAYHRRTNDDELLRSLWPNLKRALEWIDRYGDADGDGFVEYERRSADGILNQGWKDSNESVFHADGTLAEGPIALCEVQAYVYAARRAAARLARVIGERELAEGLLAEAERLRQRFEETYWLEDLGTYAMALDGAKRPCAVRSSNAGHCLFAGIAGPGRARRVASAMLGRDFFSGWGVRTIAAGQLRYNPMSYHNGSVWPHDNALIAHGIARYGMKDEALRILESQFALSMHVDLWRLPELVCGFHRRNGAGPTEYPVACAPQAWAAGSIFMLLEAVLGLRLNAAEHEITLVDPRLPQNVRTLTIDSLRLGDAEVDLVLSAHKRDVSVNVVRREGDVSVVVRK